MDRFAYIHGFNSGRNSRSPRLLEKIVGSPIICPEYDYSAPYSECIKSLEHQIFDTLEPRDRLVLMGCSLGGFYALQLRHPSVMHVLAWNPAVYPAVQLRQFLGKNTRFSDGTDWIFTEEACRSYAKAPDPRRWDLRMHGHGPSADAGGMASASTVPPRNIFLGDSDEVLDSALAKAFWEGHAEVRDIHSGHSIEDYTPMAQDILRDADVRTS